MTHSPIFRIIKDAGRPLTFGEIYKAYPSTTLEEELVGLIVEGWLRRLPDGKYWPKRYLEPPLKPEDREPQPGYYEYESIQKGTGETKTGKYYSPFKPFFPKLWSQGDRGTCVAGRTHVLMADMTYKPINVIKDGELVFTHTGKIRRVIERMKRPWQGVTYKISITGIPEPIECTKEHPFLTGRGWVEAEQLTTRDHVYFPNLIDETNDKTLNEFERDPDFLWVLGLYLAEGSIDRGISNGSKVVFSLHSKEIEFAERVREVMQRYGTTVTYQQKGENGLIVRLAAGYDGYWCNIFEELGGKMCFGKRIHHRLMTLDPQLQINIFDGWFAGDGYTRFRHGNNNRVGVSTSEALIYQMQRILARNHIYGSIQKRADQDGRLQSWNLEIIGDAGDSYRRTLTPEGAFVRINTIEKVPNYFGEHVYNLEVEEDHSYIVEGIAVHNCVGHGTAIFAQSNYLALTGDYPTDEEIASAKPDIEEDIGCKLVYDKWYHTIFSPQYIYETSRIIGNVTYPSGSFCSAAVKALKKWGAVTWDRCLTSKTVFCAPKFYPLTQEECEDLAKDHKIDGYATVTTFQSVMDAIDQNHAHCVLMPINVEYDYLNPTSDGLWRVHPGREKAGSHALPWIAVDWDRRWIGCWNSWGDAVPQITWIDEAYYRENAGPGFVSLDKDEVKIARTKYAKLTLDANVPATFYLDSLPLDGQPATAMVEKGIGYLIGAVAKETGKTMTQEIVIEDVDEVKIDFEFIIPKPEQPGWLVDLLKKIAEMLSKWRR